MAEQEAGSSPRLRVVGGKRPAPPSFREMAEFARRAAAGRPAKVRPKGWWLLWSRGARVANDASEPSEA
jgi:hypothetical protein